MRSFIFSLVFLIACQISAVRPGYPVTPNVAVKSTFKVNKLYDGSEGGSGTAWVVKTTDKWTYLLTAGHLCDDTIESPFGTVTFQYTKKDYVLTSPQGDRYAATEVKKAYNSILGTDLCLLKVPDFLAQPLLISARDPEYAERLYYVGAPVGMYGVEGFAPVYEGLYCGHKYMCAPTIGGASGSPIFMGDGVVGVLVTVDRRFHHITGFITRQAILDFMEDAKRETP